MNEHICASAMYYYDCENITESRLAFRGAMDVSEIYEDADHNQHKYRAIEDIHGIKNGDSCVLPIGQVVTRQGRVVTFSNTM